MIKFLFSIFVICLLAACCPSGTTVVLIPDASGKVGQVALKTNVGSTMLTKANQSAGAENIEKAPSQAMQLSDKEIHDKFAETLAKEPLPPQHFKFYFESGQADLLAEAAEELAKAKMAIDERKSCDISVIGHADRVGDNQSNRGISLKRADTVAKAILDLGIAKTCMDLRYYGENDPAVPTADNVAEPLNRRVEIEIR